MLVELKNTRVVYKTCLELEWEEELLEFFT